ncbi:hypothetical protein ASPZODRAFT_134229 [Penicilliopsis zonata CBS 506.65]|uniref:Serine/arginine repetitive matrix protein 1 n=1 Tax=Penicilliopsis zonata CBS 506.65 TaxID=1073090 RepID=A0A1L9SCI3_9EURO|nr:hypothetical protein ASPZODRAFT_134229 [Penicilliopsis zonata CBS 506.65]OJJ44839.1 hypothetical protein ASPZODRAFT_134229 [Penicilliopsis zonata CBS 506.65]
MIWDRDRRFDDRRGGETYRPPERSGRSPGFIRHRRSPSRARSPRFSADSWVPPARSTSHRIPSRSRPPFRHRSRSPAPRRETQAGYYRRSRSPRRHSPRREERPKSPSINWRTKTPYAINAIKGFRDETRDQSPQKRVSEAPPPGGNQISLHRECDRSSLPTANTLLEHPSPAPRGSTWECKHQPPIHTRSRSPFQKGHPHSLSGDTIARRSPSPRRAPSVYTSAADSVNTSTRSSPQHHGDTGKTAYNSTTSRSPTMRPAQTRQYSQPDIASRSQEKSTSQVSGLTHTGMEKVPLVEDRIAPAMEKGNPKTKSTGLPLLNPKSPNDNKVTRDAPTQPKSHNLTQNHLPPSGPTHGSRASFPQVRGPNISLLSAPTRPRGGPNARENSWLGTPIPRRGHIVSVTRPPPSGPRGSFPPPVPVSDLHRHSPYRQGNSAVPNHSRPSKASTLISGLLPMIPGGKLLPLGLDSATMKRLSHPLSDKERLMEQVTEKQNTKRLELREWERLERESSISTLKSELSEGHLQRMTENDHFSGTALF